MSRGRIPGPRAADNRHPFGTIYPTDTAKINDATIITDIRVAMDGYHRFVKTKNADGSDRNVFQLRTAARPHTELIEAAAALFGQLNGWRRTDRAFRIGDIGRQSGEFASLGTDLMDHCIWYRAAGRCAAIVAQPYSGAANDEHARAVAADHGVACHIPPHPLASFHFPGATKFYVFTLLDHQIVWLPEQTHGGSDGKHF